MSENGVVVSDPASPPQLHIDVSRVLEIVKEENPLAHEMAMRRATIEAQAKLIEELTNPNR